jgi:hypothetical protein
MAKVKYGLILKNLTPIEKSKLVSIEAYMGAAGINNRKLRMGNDFWVTIEATYGVKFPRGTPPNLKIIIAHDHIVSLSKDDRKSAQSEGRKAGIPKLKKPHFERFPSKAEKSEFYKSWDWTTLRKEVINEFGPRCQCCGSTPKDKTVSDENVRIVVDHVKPLHYYWSMRLERSNLQVLCQECNMGKGAWDETDHRV